MEYFEFVDSVTSRYSKDLDMLVERMKYLEGKVDLPRLLTSAIGLCDESGEFTGLVKKVIFHGVEPDKEKLVDELSDVLWYLANACISLGISLEDLMEHNIEKLEKRYPRGFEHAQDEIRQE